MTLPALSPERRQQALDKATAARRARSELLEQVKNGTTTWEMFFSARRTTRARARPRSTATTG